MADEHLGKWDAAGPYYWPDCGGVHNPGFGLAVDILDPEHDWWLNHDHVYIRPSRVLCVCGVGAES